MRYHNYMLFMLRKEREMESQEWEFDFSNPPETVVCANCGQVHLEALSVAKTVWNGQEEVTYHYCGQNCQQDDYLKKLAVQLYG